MQGVLTDLEKRVFRAQGALYGIAGICRAFVGLTWNSGHLQEHAVGCRNWNSELSSGGSLARWEPRRIDYSAGLAVLDNLAAGADASPKRAARSSVQIKSILA